MAGIRWPPEDAEVSHARALSTADLFSDDDRSVAADSWSIKSDYGSNLEDEQRHVDASDSLSTRDYSSDKEETYAEVEPSSLGLQSYWDATYADELANFHEHGHAGEIWFGAEVMDIIASWTKNLCIDIAQGHVHNPVDEVGSEAAEQSGTDLSGWSVLDVGTGNGLLLQELSKQGFYDLTGIDYSEGATELARSLAARGGFTNIYFLTDDLLETKLERQFQLVMDKGTLDAIGLHPDGPVKRIMYWDSVSRLVAPGGILVITSCNSTKDELVQEVENLNLRRLASFQNPEIAKDQEMQRDLTLQYVNHVESYSTFTFGGSEGSHVATVAFLLS